MTRFAVQLDDTIAVHLLLLTETASAMESQRIMFGRTRMSTSKSPALNTAYHL